MTLSDKNYRYIFLVSIVVISFIFSVSMVNAVDIEDQYRPTESEVDSEIKANITLTNLYEDSSNNYWTLNAYTKLNNPSWVLSLYNISGERINRELYHENDFNYTEISVSNNITKIKLEVIGETPKISNYTYMNPQRFTILEITQKNQDTTNQLANLKTYYYTEESRNTRNLLDTIKNDIENKNSSVSNEAKDLYNNSVSSFNNGNIENSLDLARQAEQKIENTQTAQIFASTGIIIGILLIIAVITYIIISNRKKDKLG